MPKKPIEHWQILIDHINDTWVTKKRVDFGYPFIGRDFRDLAGFVRNFKIWGLMSLWDNYLDSNNEWVRDKGYSINVFCSCLVWLVDIPGWKARARQYEDKIVGKMDAEVLSIIKNIGVI